MRREAPLVSVIVPVYNGGQFLAEALYSVVNQTYQPLEILLIDDGSTDNSAEIARSFPAVGILKQENNGAAAARNRGVENCHGEFVAFLDADDYWVQEKIELQMDHFRVHADSDCVCGWFQNFFQPGTELPPGMNKDHFLNDKRGKMPALGALLVRRNVFDRIGFFNSALRTENDLDWLIRLRDAGITIFFLNKVLLFRRLHGSNLSYRVSKTNLLNIFRESIRRKE